MDFGVENATRLAWRSAPDLLLNEESLVDVIAKLRAQVQAIERNELLSGAALPPWLLKALTEVASSVDSVVECQALQDQVNFLQKEVLDLRHELLVQQSNNSGGGGGGGGNAGAGGAASSSGYSPTPHHRLSTGGLRPSGSQRKIGSGRPMVPLATVVGGTALELDANMATATATAALVSAESQSSTLPLPPSDALLKPLWDCIHRQTNDFAALRDAFRDAKDTVARLQSEIKRRDAVVQARNSKHEDVVQRQVAALNESLRACVTRNDLIGAEQRIAQQMKADRQRTLDEVETRSNQLLDDLLASRAEQEDINSLTGETTQLLARKQGRLEELVADLATRQQDARERAAETQRELEATAGKLGATTSALGAVEDKMRSFVDTQAFVAQLAAESAAGFAAQDALRGALEAKCVARIAESVAVVRSEVEAVNSTLMDVVNQNLDGELKAVAGKLDMVALTAVDSAKKLALLQKQHAAMEDQSRAQFAQAFDSVDRILGSLSNLSEESIRLSYTLQHVMQSGDALAKVVSEYGESTDHKVAALQKHTHALQADVDKTNRHLENELGLVKNQLFHAEDAVSSVRRDLEATQGDVERNARSQHEENREIAGALSSLHAAKDDMAARQDTAESQLLALQAATRAEIQAATAKLVAVVDKESDRVEALYASFQAKQEHFADVVAKSSLRNMDLADLTREIDKVCESFVQECWKFEISARASSRAGTRAGDNNNSGGGGAGRKLFNERQQQLLVHNCQFVADLIVARAEYEALQLGCNKEVKQQSDLEELMLDAQAALVDKVKVKVHTKVMNNKNIGEQFDKSTLDRRELYIDSVSNMLTASIKRRTMGGCAHDLRLRRDEPSGGGGGIGGSYFESQRLLGLGTAGNASSRRKTTARERESSSSRQSLSLVASGLTADAESTRAAFSPGASYVFRAGFRLPKASPPNSPAMRGSSTAGSLLGLSEMAVGEDGESSVVRPPPPEMDDSAGDKPPLGWSLEDSKEQDGGSNMAKSYSLPVLKQ
ncbi:hypothetical protein PybrP1_006859 [[Pythium] brassicae (nom. inval.)]|nr:hypothetical protein PybrP1_006859 [[Pythium] brassicae (nom. inval.)]